MLRVVACQQKPSSFKDQHKNHVKNFLTKVQKRTTEHIQIIKSSSDKLQDDFKEFRIDTLKLMNEEFNDYVKKQQTDEDEDHSGI